MKVYDPKLNKSIEMCRFCSRENNFDLCVHCLPIVDHLTKQGNENVSLKTDIQKLFREFIARNQTTSTGMNGVTGSATIILY